MTRPSPARRLATLRIARGLLTGVGLLFLTGAMTVDFDELDCEAAVAQLASCCPAFVPAAVSCERDGGCGYTGTLPSLSRAESACILALSCDQIVATQMCDKVLAAPPNSWDDCPGEHGCGGCLTGGEGPPVYTVHPSVCP